MYLKNLSIQYFKNITFSELEFSKKINCFIGENGVGKTNVLDTIYYLSSCRSYFHASDLHAIKHGEESMMLKGIYHRNEKEETISCGVKLKQKKQFKRNNKTYQKLSEHIGLLPVVMVSPSDVKLVIEGSEERRRYIDTVISQYDSIYLDYLIRYNRVLSQRNALLKQGSRSYELFEVLDMQLTEYALKVYEKRNKFINELIPVFNIIYASISQSKESVNIKYRSHVADNDLRTLLSENFERDCILGYTTKGIHKDDLDFTLGEYPIKREGSQGQRKTFLVSLKLAQYEFLRRLNNILPILLLDDVFDKLDKNRVERIVNLVSQEHFGQIFITDTNRAHIKEILSALDSDFSIFDVNKGKIKNTTDGLI